VTAPSAFQQLASLLQAAGQSNGAAALLAALVAQQEDARR
jgi:hypothetical protein